MWRVNVSYRFDCILSFYKKKKQPYTVLCIFPQIEMLRISHDNKGTNAGWFLDDVTVDIPSRGDKVVFPCHRWLADDEDDGKIERELYPGQRTHTNPSNYSVFVIYLCIVIY